MAACYSADDDGTVQLPFDLLDGRAASTTSGRAGSRVDPVRMARARPDVVAGLRAVYIDAGTRDEFFLDLGAEAFRRECETAGVPELRFELFDAKHGGIDYRYPIALAWLAERLGAT